MLGNEADSLTDMILQASLGNANFVAEFARSAGFRASSLFGRLGPVDRVFSH
jgi:hypothetical protein